MGAAGQAVVAPEGGGAVMWPLRKRRTQEPLLWRRLSEYEQPERREGETMRAFCDRIIDEVVDASAKRERVR